MIRIAICDDNRNDAQDTKSLLMSFMEENAAAAFQVKVFSSAAQLLASMSSEPPYHLYLLDILMPDRNGIDLGREIHNYNPSSLVIYLSSSPDFAMDAFHVFAFQYIVKPVTKANLFPILSEALLHLKDTDTSFFLLKTKTGLMRLECSQIMYVEYLNHMIVVNMEDESIYNSITMRNNFDEIVKPLTKLPFFIKPHKAFLLNMNYVICLQGRDFTLKNSTLIPISRNNYAAIKKLYIDFMLNKGYEGKYDDL